MYAPIIKLTSKIVSLLLIEYVTSFYTDVIRRSLFCFWINVIIVLIGDYFEHSLFSLFEYK